MSTYREKAILVVALALLAALIAYQKISIHQSEVAEQERAARCSIPVTAEPFRRDATCLGYVPENRLWSVPRG